MSIFQHPLLLVFFSCLLCPVACFPGDYGPPKEVKSGHCPSAELIKSAADCQAAATVLGLGGTVKTVNWGAAAPSGCSWDNGGGGILRFNTNKASTRACGDGNNVNRMCLCVDPCPIGNYQNEESSKTCKSCLLGTYNDETGQALCKRCLSGTYNDKTGQASCKKCIAGTYSSEIGVAFCNGWCAIGTYSSEMGATSSQTCQDCPIGTYNSEIGESTCQNCTMGKYNNEIGEWTCRTCPVGQTSRTGASNCQPICCHAKPGYSTYEKDCNMITDATACTDQLYHLLSTCVWNCNVTTVVDMHNVSQKYLRD